MGESKYKVYSSECEQKQILVNDKRFYIVSVSQNLLTCPSLVKIIQTMVKITINEVKKVVTTFS